MNRQRSTNYQDHIEFVIALMTKDYEKARNVGNRLLQQNRNDVDLTRALNILEHKKHEEYERSSLIESKREGSDVTDGGGTDFIDDNADIRIDPEIASEIASHGVSRLNNEAKTRLDRKPKMHRVIPIKANEKVTQIKDLTRC